MNTSTVITGTGSYVPDVIKNNSEFAINNFYTNAQEPIPNAAGEIIENSKRSPA